MYFFKPIILRFLLIYIIFLPLALAATEIDFTRFLMNYSLEESTENSDSFFGTQGPARLIVARSNTNMNLKIHLNNNEIIIDKTMNGEEIIELPISLIEQNIIKVSLQGVYKDKFTLRIKQSGKVNLNVISRIHFNTNVTDFSRTKEFFNKLGFEKLSGAPETNTLAMAEAIGIETPTKYDGSKGGEPGGYLLHAELLGKNNFKGGVIDVIEFTIPRNDEKPYQFMNQIGMISASLITSNIKADYEYMLSIGINFLASPKTLSDGRRFAIFQDPDGTFYKLVEGMEKTDEFNKTYIYEIGEVTFNVTDIERSEAWYKMFGFKTIKRLTNNENIETSRGLGFSENIVNKSIFMQHQEDQSRLEFIKWIKPYENSKPYSIPINHPGIHRIAFATTNIEDDVRQLKLQGVEFISDITPCCSGPNSSSSIVAFYDPDGIIVELAEIPFFARIFFPIILWFRGLVN